MLITDILVLIIVAYGTQFIWLGNGNAVVLLRETGPSVISYWIASAALVLLWLWALSLSDSRSVRIVGVGNTEYIRVFDTSLRLFGLIAIFAFLFQVDLARGYLLISLPVGIVALIFSRWLWRQWLAAKRRRGE